MRTVTSRLLDPSFPSGHTTAAFSIVGGVSVAFGSVPLVLWPIAGVVGISRIYLGHHYPTDVLAGALIGGAFAVLTGYVFG